MTIQDFQDRLCGYRPTLQQARAEFAVLVPLIERPDGLHLLYEVRAQNLRHHAAEVCFPGGRDGALRDAGYSAPCARRGKSWPLRRRTSPCSASWTFSICARSA